MLGVPGALSGVCGARGGSKASPGSSSCLPATPLSAPFCIIPCKARPGIGGWVFGAAGDQALEGSAPAPPPHSPQEHLSVSHNNLTTLHGELSGLPCLRVSVPGAPQAPLSHPPVLWGRTKPIPSPAGGCSDPSLPFQGHRGSCQQPEELGSPRRHLPAGRPLGAGRRRAPPRRPSPGLTAAPGPAPTPQQPLVPFWGAGWG